MMKFLEILNKRIFLSDKEKILLKLLNINSARAVDIMMYIPYKWNKKKILYKYFELKDGVDCILFVKINI